MHHPVAAAFLGARPPGFRVNHKDGDKQNPRASNLEYVRSVENVRHAVAPGLWNHAGERNGHRQLTSDQVDQIRKLRGTLLRKLIAEQFGIRPNTVTWPTRS